MYSLQIYVQLYNKKADFQKHKRNPIQTSKYKPSFHAQKETQFKPQQKFRFEAQKRKIQFQTSNKKVRFEVQFTENPISNLNEAADFEAQQKKI
jgi:poly-gamma-glutamate capsule biosynthesis protein CapA/YwtB (metallophosphatase superfamily)